MHQEDIERARNLISQTTILSSVEKAEWAQLLPQMNDKQILELIKILAPTPVSQPTKVDLNQKEISTSIPFYEKELSAPGASGAQQPRPQATAQPKPAVPNLPSMPSRPTSVSSNEPLPIPRPVSSAAQGPAPEPLYGRPTPDAAPAQARPQATGRPNVPNIPSIQRSTSNREESQAPATQQPSGFPESYSEPHAQQPVKIVFQSPDEFLKLNPTMLHGKDPYPLLQAILNSIVEFSKKQKFLPVIYNIERSPLQKAYVDFGLRLLNDSSVDREEAYNRVIGEAKARGQDILTKEEFEAFTDFRKELNKLLVI